MVTYTCKVNQWTSGKIPYAFVRNATNPTGLFNFNYFTNFCMPRGAVIYSLESSLVCSLHPPLMVFVMNVIRCELISQTIRNAVGILFRTIF